MIHCSLTIPLITDSMTSHWIHKTIKKQILNYSHIYIVLLILLCLNHSLQFFFSDYSNKEFTCVRTFSNLLLNVALIYLLCWFATFSWLSALLFSDRTFSYLANPSLIRLIIFRKTLEKKSLGIKILQEHTLETSFKLEHTLSAKILSLK